MLNIDELARQCAPSVHPSTMAAVVRVESSFNPFAIGVVGGRLERQPRTKAEAVATARALEAAAYDFSLGIGQVNRHNLSKYGLDYQTAFEPCQNLGAASLILKDCYDRAKAKGLYDGDAAQAALSCYYSGDFSTGFHADAQGRSYVQRVLNSAGRKVAVSTAQPMPKVATRRRPAAQARVADIVRVTAAGPTENPAVTSENGVERDAVMVYR